MSHSQDGSGWLVPVSKHVALGPRVCLQLRLAPSMQGIDPDTLLPRVCSAQLLVLGAHQVLLSQRGHPVGRGSCLLQAPLGMAQPPCSSDTLPHFQRPGPQPHPSPGCGHLGCRRPLGCLSGGPGASFCLRLLPRGRVGGGPVPALPHRIPRTSNRCTEQRFLTSSSLPTSFLLGTNVIFDHWVFP